MYGVGHLPGGKTPRNAPGVNLFWVLLIASEPHEFTGNRRYLEQVDPTCVSGGFTCHCDHIMFTHQMHDSLIIFIFMIHSTRGFPMYHIMSVPFNTYDMPSAHSLCRQFMSNRIAEHVPSPSSQEKTNRCCNRYTALDQKRSRV
jgi:hypothetical protein